MRLIKSSPHRLCLIALLFAFFVALGGYAAINVWPALGARGADALRGLIGDRAVAELEMIVFQTQDAIAQLFQLRAGPGTSPVGPVSSGETMSSDWLPDSLPPSGLAAGEGEWVSYIQDSQGRTVAYRTFLLPDPHRSYARATLLAFDLDATRLHFMLGTEEPRSSVTLERPGRIPEADLQAGALLAVLNGGFKARHGSFGVMVNGVTVLPLREGLGTVALYAEGQARIGRWGDEITATPDLVAARQNGLLIVHEGVTNPYTEYPDANHWGYFLRNTTPTWRSGLGISADGRTLYYVVGSNLTLSGLAQALATAGAAEALQLDINKAWVYAGAVHATESGLSVLPLLDFMPEIDRLEDYSFSRDFFYLTSF